MFVTSADPKSADSIPFFLSFYGGNAPVVSTTLSFQCPVGRVTLQSFDCIKSLNISKPRIRVFAVLTILVPGLATLALSGSGHGAEQPSLDKVAAYYASLSEYHDEGIVTRSFWSKGRKKTQTENGFSTNFKHGGSFEASWWDFFPGIGERKSNLIFDGQTITLTDWTGREESPDETLGEVLYKMAGVTSHASLGAVRYLEPASKMAEYFRVNSSRYLRTEVIDGEVLDIYQAELVHPTFPNYTEIIWINHDTQLIRRIMKEIMVPEMMIRYTHDIEYKKVNVN